MLKRACRSDGTERELSLSTEACSVIDVSLNNTLPLRLVRETLLEHSFEIQLQEEYQLVYKFQFPCCNQLK